MLKIVTLKITEDLTGGQRTEIMRKINSVTGELVMKVLNALGFKALCSSSAQIREVAEKRIKVIDSIICILE